VTASVDPLPRLERTAVGICAAMAAVALAVSSRPLDAALGVVGGGALVAVSYRALKAFVNALTAAEPRRNAAGILLRLLLRYALLVFLAYVMIARLRLHPLGLLAGASSVVAAVSIEAARLLTKKT
jgi:hypothetical protein